MLRERRTRWPAHLPVETHVPTPLADRDEVRLTFIGHSSFLIQSGAGNILLDPVFAERASPLRFAGPRRVRAPAIPFESLPEIAMVLLSHNHYDHCDIAALRALHRRFAPRYVTTLGNGALLRRLGIAKIEELDWWQDAATSIVPVTCTPAQHFSGRTPFDRNDSLWGGFVLRFGEVKLFFAGESGFGPHFSEIGALLGPFDLRSSRSAHTSHGGSCGTCM